MADWKDIAKVAPPKDGTVILVWGNGYEWPEAVQWESYDGPDAEEIGADGYWTYAEELLAEVTDSCCEEEWTHWAHVVPPTKDTPQ
ncbi:MAG: hypothetical protein ACO1SX_06885 [Actinomycetota bacterium]